MPDISEKNFETIIESLLSHLLEPAEKDTGRSAP